MKSTRIVSAFPACGKSYLFNKGNLSCLDSDSSKFSWVMDEEGKSTGVRNPDFPENYIKHIKDNVGKVDYIFVSSHDIVKKALEDNHLNYILVMPDESLKYEWIGRCWVRGNNNEFLKLIDSMWESWTNKIKITQEWNPVGTVYLQSGEFLSDKMWFIENCTPA